MLSSAVLSAAAGDQVTEEKEKSRYRLTAQRTPIRI
jgi:hypothetical protein